MSLSEETKDTHESGWKETIKVVIHALILALIVRTLLYQPFNIPSGSMKSTLLVGDYLFVSKFSYGYSRYSFPFGPPVIKERVWGSEPKRGDVIVFKLPSDNETDYIKRLIGMPGDEIQMIGGVLHINGNTVPKRQIADFVMRDSYGNQRRVPRFEETLPNGVTYKVLDIHPNGSFDNTQVYKVPAGHYFMMGDNRDNSRDSRATYGVGFVPYRNLVGRADVIFFSIDESSSIWRFWEWPTAIRWSRMFTLVD